MELTVKFSNYQELNDFCNGVVIAPALLELESGEKKAPKKKAKVEETKAEETKVEIMPEPIQEEVKEVSIEEVRALLGKLQKEGKKEEVKEIIASFGVDKLSQIKPEDYAELMRKAGELSA